MTITNVASTNPLDQLARALVGQFDANKDGTLTTDEFSAFLTQFLGSTNTLTTATTTTTPTTANGLKNGTVVPRLIGFNADKLADVNHDTVKYKIGRVMQQYSLENVKTKSDAEALLTSMKGDFEKAGVNILEVEKDRLKFKDDSGHDVWIDAVHATGSSKMAWQWLFVG
jgi:hypothetical protein